MTMSSRHVAFAAIAAATGTVAALLLAEISLRIAGFEFALYPTTVQFGWPDPVTLEERYTADRDLLWVPRDYDATLDAWSGRRPTVAHMGDSCTEFGRYDEHLAALIARDDPDYTFVNLGAGGWSSHQGLAQMRRDVVRLRPAVATIYFGWNDHWRSYGVPDRDIGDFVRDQPRWVDTLSRSRLVQLMQRAAFTRRRRALETRTGTPERVSLPDFQANLAAMVRTAREHGTEPVLMTAPTSHRAGEEPAYLVPRWIDDLDRLVPLHLAYVDVVRDVARAHDVILIDLYGEFSALPPEDLDAYFNEDGIHLNEAGNARIAQIMHDHFVRHGLVEAVRGPR
jgi:lysophospholipase L1-like esterase